MAEVLSRQGYDTAAFIAAFVLDGRWGLNQGFRLYDDQFDSGSSSTSISRAFRGAAIR